MLPFHCTTSPGDSFTPQNETLMNLNKWPYRHFRTRLVRAFEPDKQAQLVTLDPRYLNAVLTLNQWFMVQYTYNASCYVIVIPWVVRLYVEMIHEI